MLLICKLERKLTLTDKIKIDQRAVPIPSAVTNSSALDYHQIAIDIDGQANSEPLVPVSDFALKHRSAYAHSLAPYYKAFDKAHQIPHLRRGVAARLAKVNETLKDYGVELLILDGYRPVALQQELWDHFIDMTHIKFPDKSEDELVKFVGQYWSDPRSFDPDDYRTWPTHNTGGAVDLTLQDIKTGQDLYMGGVFDDVDEISSTRHYEDDRMLSLSAREARQNRRLLFHCMSHVGFANYHHEWWHFDYGTQMAIMNGFPEAKAFYGRATMD